MRLNIQIGKHEEIVNSEVAVEKMKWVLQRTPNRYKLSTLDSYLQIDLMWAFKLKGLVSRGFV